MSLYTCCVTQIVQLDVVDEVTYLAFFHSLKRSTSRRDFPVIVVFDNAKAFKAAAKTVNMVLETPEVKDPNGKKMPEEDHIWKG